MKLLDEKGLETVWSTCKVKFALADHTHNYAGSNSAGGSANSAIGVVDYNQTSQIIQIGYSGAGITGDQIKFIAGYTDGGGNVNAKIKDISKDALKSWLGLGSLAYSSATITDNKVAQNAIKSSDYTNWRSLVFSAANSATEGFTPATTTDGVFITNTLSVQPATGTVKATKFKGSLEGNASTASNASKVNGHTVNSDVPSGAKFTDTNTWRGIQDNLTSSSASDSLSANQGKILKGLVDSKANSYEAASMEFEIIIRQAGVDYSSQYISITSVDKKVQKSLTIDEASTSVNGLMSAPDKRKLDGIASGANNYSLPVASADTLGGIKVGYSGTLTGYDFPVKLDDEGNAVANIDGLFAINGVLKNINFTDGNTITTYDVNSIYHDTPSGRIKFIFPSKSGKFALESDCSSTVMSSSFSLANGKHMIDFKSSQQTVLLEDSGNYDISNWYSYSSTGDVLDMYAYGLQGGLVSASQSNLFRMMKVLATSPPKLSVENSISIAWNMHIRMIHTRDAVFVCTYTLND